MYSRSFRETPVVFDLVLFNEGIIQLKMPLVLGGLGLASCIDMFKRLNLCARVTLWLFNIAMV